ncbi:MAG: TAT-variant-translocated molybdopterin oxidoreductase [Acidobacteriota bacterium]
MDILKILKEQEEPPSIAAPRVDLTEIRERLEKAEGRQFWRSLDQLADTEEFRELVFREFPRQASEWAGGATSRRRFLQLMSASLALGGLTGCVKQPSEKIVPYVRQPPEVKPGTALKFATMTSLGGYAASLLAESHTGRPTKLEGNPQHPASLGASDAYSQAKLLDLYDPDRSQQLKDSGRPRTWDAMVADLQPRLEAMAALGGAGLHVLTGKVSSPTLAKQFDQLREKMPQARWHCWEPASAHPASEAQRQAFGRPVEVRYDLSQVDVLVTLDSDFLTRGPGSLRYAGQFGERRRIWEIDPESVKNVSGGHGHGGDHGDDGHGSGDDHGGQEAHGEASDHAAVEDHDGGAPGPKAGERKMARFYALEASPTSSSTLADHRLPLTPADLTRAAAALAARVGVAGATDSAPAAAEEMITVIAEDLKAAGKAALVVAGRYADPALQVLAFAINEALGSSAISFSETIDANPVEQISDLADLVDSMNSGRADLVVILGGNPVFDAPAELGFGDALLKATEAIYLGPYENETSNRCRWHVPELHFLETWADARSYDGIATLAQPLIEPLYWPCKSAGQIVSMLAGRTDATDYDSVRTYWEEQGLDEDAWRRAVHDGFVADTEAPAVALAVAPAAIANASSSAATTPVGDLELSLRPDPTIWDGRFVNNGWLQECPKPLTKLTWDNAFLIGPSTAESLGLNNNDRVDLTVGERTLSGVAVWIQPGIPAGAATLHFGYGGKGLGRVGAGTGFNTYAIRQSAHLWTCPVTLRKASGTYELASTQDHGSMEGRHLVRTATLDEYYHHADFAKHKVHRPTVEQSMYPPHKSRYAWGMAIDLNSCLGCGACVIACQAENNIAVVGKDQVLKAREMHWLRIDRYYSGDLDNPEVYQQPVSCQHCEQAPCEVVCPVAATVHSPEGLNDMVYNRCVGTRYCSNNCPYKVRRFNFLQYSDITTESLKLGRNPNVTVRNRGVMEKCSYCVQRLNKARIAAKVEQRSVTDEDLLTACQQACSTKAIRFGNINDETAGVTAWKNLPLNYGLLEELNTRPRTTYLARVTNPNPKLERT